MAAARTWSISELAQEFGVTLRTIRFYEDRGLLEPERRGPSGRQRLFHPRDHVRLALILRGRRLGFSLEEIATIIGMYDAEPGEVGQLRYLLAQIEGRRHDLRQRRADIDQTLEELGVARRRCEEELARLTANQVPAAP